MCQWGYRDSVEVLGICSVQVPAGRRSNFEGLAFTSKAILRQNRSDPAIRQLFYRFQWKTPMKKMKNFGKRSYNPSKGVGRDYPLNPSRMTKWPVPAIFEKKNSALCPHWAAGRFGQLGSRAPDRLLLSCGSFSDHSVTRRRWNQYCQFTFRCKN